MGTKKTKMVDLPDGAKYGGEFVNGRPHGQGVKTWPSGLGYEGEFRDGKANGRGVETELLSNLVYDGLFMRRLCCP